MTRDRSLLPPADVRKIAIFRALYLGDLLVAVPALRAIRAGFPYAEITLIGLPWAESFVRRFHHCLDRFVPFAGYPGIAEVEVIPERVQRFLQQQRAYRYDLAIQLHGSGRQSLRFVLDLRARLAAGYYADAPPSVQNFIGAPYPDDQPEVLRNLGVARLLGCRDRGLHLEFPLVRQDHTEAAQLLGPLGKAPRPWIGLHPGASSPARRWPPEYFAAVADAGARRYDAQIVLTGGPGEEAIARSVAAQMKTRSLVVAGETSIGGLAGLIDRLDLYISNDTGPAHLADAVDTPSITIFGPVDHRRWAPLDAVRHPIVRLPVPCSPCGLPECPIDHRCLRRLHPEMVIEAADRLLVQKGILCSA